MKLEDYLDAVSDFRQVYELCSRTDEKELLLFLSANDCELLTKIIESYPHDKALEIFNLLFQDNIFCEEDELCAYADILYKLEPNQPKYQKALGCFLLNAPFELLDDENLIKKVLNLTSDDFNNFIHTRTIEDLNKVFLVYSQDEQSHMLTLVSKKFGKSILIDLLNVMKNNDIESIKKELMTVFGQRELYHELLKELTPEVEVILSLVNTIPDEVLKLYLYSAHKQVSKDELIPSLDTLSVEQLWSFLLASSADASQLLFIEKLVKKLNKDLDYFLRVISQFPNSRKKTAPISNETKNLYKLLSYPRVYAVVKKYSSNTTKDSLTKAFASAVNYVPVVGEMVTGAIESHLKDKELTEFLLHSLIRLNPEIEKVLSIILLEVAPNECYHLLNKEDSEGKALLLPLIRSNPEQDVLRVLAYCPYAVKENDRLFTNARAEVSKLREEFQHHREGASRIGLIVFMNLYAYIQVRSLESGQDTYRLRKNEYLHLLSFLSSNINALDLESLFKKYCEQHPIREGLTSNRNAQARKFITDLNKKELKEGFILFAKFIKARFEMVSTIGSLSLEEEIKSAIFKTKAFPVKNFLIYEDEEEPSRHIPKIGFKN